MGLEWIGTQADYSNCHQQTKLVIIALYKGLDEWEVF
jgi:hypothetical protein